MLNPTAPSRSSRFALLLLWVALAAGLFYAGSSLEWGQVWGAAARAEPAWLIAALILNCANAPLWAACWFCLLSFTVPWRRLVEVQSVVLASVQAFSLLGGGAAAWVLSLTRLNLTRQGALSLLVLDQLTTGLVKIVLIGAALLVVPSTPLLHIAGGAMIAGMGGFLIVLLIASRSRAKIVDLAAMRTGKSAQVLTWIAEWVGHLKVVQSPALMGGAIGFMLIRRLSEGVAGYLTAIACGIDVGPQIIPLIIASLAIVTIIPSPPGNVGLYEIAVVAAYQWLGVPAETALAAALLQHASLLIPALIPGAIVAALVPGYARHQR